MEHVYVVGIPSTVARQMLKYAQPPPLGSAPRALQSCAQALTSYLSMKAKPMYWGGSVYERLIGGEEKMKESIREGRRSKRT